MVGGVGGGGIGVWMIPSRGQQRRGEGGRTGRGGMSDGVADSDAFNEWAWIEPTMSEYEYI